MMSALQLTSKATHCRWVLNASFAITHYTHGMPHSPSQTLCRIVLTLLLIFYRLTVNLFR